MRRPAARTVLRYLRVLAEGMRLGSWELRLDEGTPEDGGFPDAHATVVVQREAAYALISLSPSLFKLPAAKQRQTLVHELVHVHLAPLDWSFEDVTTGLSKRAEGHAEATWAQRSERACDDLAWIIAARFPIPPWAVR